VSNKRNGTAANPLALAAVSASQLFLFLTKHIVPSAAKRGH
jgi:hypothetical protein